jgi:CheY-like chemotaxis protein
MRHDRALILCIDCDGRRAEGRRLLLEQSGYEVRVAHHAQVGQDLLTQCPADLILVHHELLAVHGNVVASEIKRFKPDVPVVLIVGPAGLAATELCFADAIVREADPWPIVLDKVNELVKASGPFFQRWLEGWKRRGSAQLQEARVAARGK